MGGRNAFFLFRLSPFLSFAVTHVALKWEIPGDSVRGNEMCEKCPITDQI